MATQPETPTAERFVVDGVCLERTTRAPIAGAVVLSDEPTATAIDGTFHITFGPDQQVLRIELQHPDYVQQTVTISRENVPIAPERFEVMRAQRAACTLSSRYFWRESYPVGAFAMRHHAMLSSGT